MQFPAWLCLPLFVLSYLLSCALKLNDDDDDDNSIGVCRNQNLGALAAKPCDKRGLWTTTIYTVTQTQKL